MTVLSSDLFFNDTATTEIYTLSLHDAHPIYNFTPVIEADTAGSAKKLSEEQSKDVAVIASEHADLEEHTSELQSPNLISYAVFCLKKKRTVGIGIHYGQ